MSVLGKRPFSINRDAAPPPLLPERSDAPPDSVAHAASLHSLLDGRPRTPSRLSRARGRLQSGGRRSLFDLPTSSSSASSLPSPLARTPSVSSSSSSLASCSSSSHLPPTPGRNLDLFGMTTSSDTPVTRPAKDSPDKELLPFHSRPHSKWDASLVDPDGSPHITTVPPLRSTYAPPSTYSRSSSSGPHLQAGHQSSTIRSRISSSAIAISKGGGPSADGAQHRPGGKGRDISYLSRQAPSPSVSLARPSPAATDDLAKIPYAVQATDAVREMEVLLLESIRWGILEGDYTFVKIEEGQAEPSRVLDVGCGSGYFCISQAGRWRSSHFVGFDFSGGQTDLGERARSQRERAEARRQAGREARPSKVDWADLDERIEWVRGNFLEMLPFDSGSFDLVRISFANLGIPESSWQEVLEECTRVLEKGSGVLEILEMSGDLPTGLLLTPPQSPPWQASLIPTSAAPPGRLASTSGSTVLNNANQHSRNVSTLKPQQQQQQQQQQPTSRKAQYDGLLERHMIQLFPSLTIRSSLLMQSGMSKSREVFSKTYRRSAASLPRDATGEIATDVKLDVAPGFIGAATGVWIESMFPASNGGSVPVFPTLNETITKGLLSDLAAQGVEWAQPGRFPSDAGASKKSKRRSLMPRAPAQRPEYDLGTLSFHAWVGTKSPGARA